MQKSKRRILGIPNRIYLLAFIILGFVAARFYPPVLPHIQLPAEAYTPGHPQFVLPVIGPFYWTNTLTAMVIADILIVIIALVVRRAVNSGELVPKGFAGAVEALLEVIYNLTESTAGKWARQIFPWFAAITLFVLVVNWTELIPGVDSIGIIHDVHGGEIEGHAIQPVLGGAATTIVTAKGDYSLIPWVRVLSTDLNFTVGLALVSIFMTQVFGVRALGAGYFQKFINIKGFSASPIFGAIDFGVGILELVSELSKILSFSFRLFGNIFAGTVLLFVIGTLVPVFAQSIFLMLEFFVGLIQAVVFGMLTMVYMAQATAGHGDHGGHADGDDHGQPIPGPEMI